jgi:hypothetical protein
VALLFLKSIWAATGYEVNIAGLALGVFFAAKLGVTFFEKYLGGDWLQSKYRGSVLGVLGAAKCGVTFFEKYLGGDLRQSQYRGLSWRLRSGDSGNFVKSEHHEISIFLIISMRIPRNININDIPERVSATGIGRRYQNRKESGYVNENTSISSPEFEEKINQYQ